MRNLKWILIGLIVIVLGLMGWTYAWTGQIGLWPRKGELQQAAAGPDFAYFDKIRDERFVLSGQAQADIDILLSHLPDQVKVTHGAVSFDAETGATTIADVKLSLSVYPDFGVRIAKLDMWGADADFISQRFKGENLDARGIVAKRLHARNISLSGLEDIANDVIEPLNEEMLEDMDPEVSENLSILLSSYSFEMGDLIVNDLELHPFSLNHTPLPEFFRQFGDEDDGVEAGTKTWNLFQTLAAWHGAYGWENLAIFDLSFGMDLNQMGVDTKMTGAIEQVGYKQYDRGDMSFVRIGKSRMEMDMSMPSMGFDVDAEPVRFHQVSENSFMVMTELRWAKLLQYLARGERPPSSETDLMSFGRWESGPSSTSINGKPIYRINHFLFDFSQFHWLMPEKIEIKVDDAAYDLINYMEFFMSVMSGVSLDEETKQTFEQAIDFLEKHDLRELVFDFGVDVNWGAETGDWTGNYLFGLNKMGRFEVKSQAQAPDFDGIEPFLTTPFEAQDPDALSDLLETDYKFESLDISLIDDGGLQTGFAMAIDFSRLAPDEPGLAGIKNSTPEKLREIAANSLMIGAVEVDKAFPPAVAYLQSFSDFVLKGGRFDIALHPPQPIDFKQGEVISELVKSDPEKVEDMLGLKVTHTPPH